jgi:putative DNA primase/helicase
VGEQKKLFGHYPAMLARLIGADGKATTVHRTYLHDGRKAPVKEVKKVMSSFCGGPAIRLFEATDELAISEGIETGLAVHLRTGKPVWAAYSASNMAGLWIPDSVHKVSIYADNDTNYVGQAAAYALAKRLRSVERSTGLPEVCVHVPTKAGEDWADVYCRKIRLAA